jgi:microcin C transport system substrate-binding protein
MQNFDFDMTVMLYPESLSPGNEQRDFWTTESGKQQGGRNLLGIASPAVDDLVSLIIEAPDRQSLVTRVHALDRVLLAGHYVIPNWHFPYFRVASWDKFARAAVSPPYGLAIETWWVDPAREAALDAKRQQH